MPKTTTYSLPGTYETLSHVGGVLCIKIPNNFTQDNNGGGMMKKRITILSQEFEVKEVDEVEFGQPIFGQIRHNENLILISSKLSSDRKKVVLLHEILHSILEQLGFDIEHDNEDLIDSLATSIYQVLRDNPNQII